MAAKPSTSRIVLLAILAVVVLGGAALFLGGKPAPKVKVPGSTPSTAPQQAQAPQGTTTTTQQRVKLADTPYMQVAYLLSGPTLSPEAEQAIAGFQLKKQPLSDGSTQYTLKAINPGYKDQTFTVKPGEKLYFIEGSFGDDSQNNEYALGDDGAVLVDANGYVVQ